MILDLNEITGGRNKNLKESKPSDVTPDKLVSSPVLRIWYNTLLEFGNGEVRILRSYSVPAKDSSVQRLQKDKIVKKEPLSTEEVLLREVEEW